jgi:hypothetical protein
VQGFIQHASRRKGKPGDFDRAIMALDDATVAKAESILLSMAV